MKNSALQTFRVDSTLAVCNICSQNSQENDELISYARSLLDPPSSSSYNFTKISGSGEGQDRQLMGQYGQLGKVVQLFNGKKNGFFIECGALDGGSTLV